MSHWGPCHVTLIGIVSPFLPEGLFLEAFIGVEVFLHLQDLITALDR